MTNKFFIKTSLLISAISLFIIIAALTSCKCRACEDQEEGTVPIDVLTKADSFIVASTGKEFFDNYINADFARTRYIPPYYELAYKFFIPEKPYVNSIIKFTVDSIGNVMKDREIIGIPRFNNFPEECDYNIDEQTARKIASDMELKEGIREWDAAFIWDFKLQRYVWKILSTLNESGDEENYKATGQEMVIDPNTGEVLALNDWKIN
jgi:hypothetical protein